MCLLRSKHIRNYRRESRFCFRAIPSFLEYCFLPAVPAMSGGCASASRRRACLLVGLQPQLVCRRVGQLIQLHPAPGKIPAHTILDFFAARKCIPHGCTATSDCGRYSSIVGWRFSPPALRKLQGGLKATLRSPTSIESRSSRTERNLTMYGVQEQRYLLAGPSGRIAAARWLQVGLVLTGLLLTARIGCRRGSSRAMADRHADRHLLGRAADDRCHRQADGRGRLEPGLVRGGGTGRGPAARLAGHAPGRTAGSGQRSTTRQRSAQTRRADRPRPKASGAVRLLPHRRTECRGLRRPWAGWSPTCASAIPATWPTSTSSPPTPTTSNSAPRATPSRPTRSTCGQYIEQVKPRPDQLRPLPVHHDGRQRPVLPEPGA